MSDDSIYVSARLSTGHVLRVVFPGDSEFHSGQQVRLAMLEAAIKLRELAEACQRKAVEMAREESANG